MANVLGTAGGDVLAGPDEANTIDGFAGDDYIDGGTVYDSIMGGTGADTIYGHEGDDWITDFSEQVGEGGDDYFLGGDGDDNIYGGSGYDQLFGGDGDDDIYGDEGGGYISGDDGEDDIYQIVAFGRLTALYGDDGDDSIGVGGQSDEITTIDGGLGDDYIYGSDSDDSILGGAGEDWIDTADGDGFVDAGRGDDVIDTVYFTPARLPRPDGLTVAAVDLVGYTILGGAGDDELVAGYNTDRFDGGTGEDIVNYSSQFDAVSVNLRTGRGDGGAAEGDTYRMVEGVVGSERNDVLTGNGAVNFLDGRGGQDRIAGDVGGDVLYGGLGEDSLDYGASTSAVRVRLSDGFAEGGHSEGDQFYEFEGILGSAFNDALTGDDGGNELKGRAGLDTLDGGKGRDTLFGEDGADRLVGGVGEDRLNGGAGADRFGYLGAADSPDNSQRDVIQDFSSAQGDRIDLSAIDVNSAAAGDQAFAFVGTAAFSGTAGELRYATISGGIMIYGNIDADLDAEFSVQLNGVAGVVAGDFIL